LCTDYAWVVKDKPFFGREAMWNPHCEERLVGLTLLGRGIPREGYPVLSEGARVGTITSGTLSPLTKKGIAMAWLAAALAEVGQKLTVEIRAAHVDATVVKPPFYP
jgi:aminomethyltransferase